MSLVSQTTSDIVELGLFFPFASTSNHMDAEILAQNHVDFYGQYFFADEWPIGELSLQAPDVCFDLSIPECERNCTCLYETAQNNCYVNYRTAIRNCGDDALTGALGGCITAAVTCGWVPLPGTRLGWCGVGAVIGLAGSTGMCVKSAENKLGACMSVAFNNYAACMATKCGIIVVRK